MNKAKNIKKHEKGPIESLNRDKIELLRRRISLLEGRDRLLMSMYFEKGNSCYQIAKLLGVCESTISRRIRKLISQLTGKPFEIYRQHRKKFEPQQKPVAADHFLLGLSIGQIASRHNCSIYKVRTILKQIHTIIKAGEKSYLSGTSASRDEDAARPKHKRKEVNNGNIQHFKKFSMEGENHRACNNGLQNVRPYHQKAYRAQSCL